MAEDVSKPQILLAFSRNTYIFYLTKIITRLLSFIQDENDENRLNTIRGI